MTTPHDEMRWYVARRDLAAAMYQLSQEVRLSPKKKVRLMSITGFEPGAIQARLDALKKRATARRAQSMSKLDAADAKVASVDYAIERVAAQIEKEADDAMQEFATHTNGGPALDDPKPPTPTPTPLPPMEPINPVPGPQLAPGTVIGTIIPTVEPKKNEGSL
jgi:hypothetical protein